MTIEVQLDGLTHINIYSKGRTSLGRALTNMCLFTFEYNSLTFHSVEQAWHYFKFININEVVAKAIMNMDDAYTIKKYAKPYNNEATALYVQSQEFRSLIKDVICTRLNSDNDLQLQLRNSHLPFEHYYSFGNDITGYKVVDESDKYDWLIKIFTEYRTDLWLKYLDDLLSKHGHMCYNKATAPTNAIYVGRGSHFKNVTYGNPFPVSDSIKSIKKTDRNTFDIAVAYSVIKYRSHLIGEIRKNPRMWYEALNNLKNNPLQCFCNNGKDSRLLGGGFCHSLILSHFAENVDEIYLKTGLIQNGNIRKNCSN